MFMMFFFFKQKTAYDMRISDWSSDVCSSDLLRGRGRPDAVGGIGLGNMGGGPVGLRVDGDAAQTEAARRAHHAPRNLTPVGDQHRLKHSDQSPRQAGLRFSRTAATPSRASAEARSSADRKSVE